MKLYKLFLSIIITLLFAIPALAEEAFDIQSFKTDMQINKDSSVDVTEIIDVNFNENRHGIYRDIQSSGIKIKILDVTDSGHNSYDYEEQIFGEGTRLKIGDPDTYVIGKKVYNISYKVKKVIRFLPNHDELYWNATGTEWPTQIKQAVVTIKLPEGIKGKNPQLKCYTGSYSSTKEDCTYKYDLVKNEVIFKSNNVLPAYSGITIVVGFPKGILKPPATLEVKTIPDGAKVHLDNKFICKTNCYDDTLYPGSYNVQLNKFGHKTIETKAVQLISGKSTMQYFMLEPYLWLYLLEFLFFLLLLVVALEPVYTFWKKGRDPEGRGSIMPQYEPPEDLSPAEMGTLVDEKVHIRDITSTIVDLAVRGYIKIEVLPDAKGLIFKKDDYKLIKIENPKPKGRRALTSFEINFMKKVFGNDKSKKISDLEDKFYEHLSSLENSLYQSLVKKKYFPKSPKTIRSKYVAKGILLIVLIPFLISFELILFNSAYTAALFVNGIFSLIFASFMPKKTEKGALALEHILGFKHYMEIAEKDRLKFQEKENIFYEILPYAMTLKVADRWSKAFKNVFKDPPDWYQGVGSGGFYPSDFTHNIQSMSSSINTAFRSAPSSSSSSFGSSSGSSGFSGGSSGGGSGGGGGGSW